MAPRQYPDASSHKKRGPSRDILRRVIKRKESLKASGMATKATQGSFRRDLLLASRLNPELVIKNFRAIHDSVDVEETSVAMPPAQPKDHEAMCDDAYILILEELDSPADFWAYVTSSPAVWKLFCQKKNYVLARLFKRALSHRAVQTGATVYEYIKSGNNAPVEHLGWCCCRRSQYQLPQLKSRSSRDDLPDVSVL